jgi:hypothetical protein
LKTLSILYAPGVKHSQIGFLERKLKDFIERINLDSSDIQINPPQFLRLGNSSKNEDGLTIVVGWGLPSIPAWDRWMGENKVPKTVRQFIAVDLFERRGTDGRLLKVPCVNAGRYWSKRTRRMNLGLFFEGCYLRPTAPFGMKRVLSKRKKDRAPSGRSHHKLVPAEAEKIEIVRLIFDLFVNSDYTLTGICNLLNAQMISPPNRISAAWHTRMIRAVLCSWAYIGANEYCGCVKQSAFPPIIEKTIFFEAQAKMSRKQIEIQ